MASGDIFVGMILGGLAAFLVAGFFLAGRKLIRRNWVWMILHRKGGPVTIKEVKRQNNGTISFEKSRYFIPARFGIHKRKPIYEYVQGDPRALQIATKHTLSANPGEIKEVHFLAPQTIPGETLEVFMKQKIAADIYSGRLGMMLIILIGVVFLVLLVLGLYARR